MSIELSVLLIVAAGIGGFLLGRYTDIGGSASFGPLGKKAKSHAVGLVCYDCEERNAVVNVAGGPAYLAAYAWDNSGGGANPTNIPPEGSKVVSTVNNEMDIPDVPHENDATQIRLQIWGVDTWVDTEIDCDDNSWACSSSGSSESSGSSGSNSSEAESQASVLP